MFERSNINITDLVLIKQLEGLIRVRAVIHGFYIFQPLIDKLPGKDRALLFLVPNPSHDGRQPGVDRYARSPTIERGVGFKNGGYPGYILSQPGKRLAVPFEDDRPAIIGIDRGGHIFGAVEGHRVAVVEAVSNTCRNSREWIKETGSEKDSKGPPPAIAPAAARLGVTLCNLGGNLRCP